MTAPDIAELERQLGSQVLDALNHSSRNSPRAQQQNQFLIGISDLGTCQERTRRLLAEIPEVDQTDILPAFIGTAIGKDVEAAVKALHPEVITQAAVVTTLVGDGGEYEVTGHPDMIFPWGVADLKTTDGLELPRRSGPTQQQLFQRHLYTKAAWEAGLLKVDRLEDARTANIWLDRSGATKELHVHMDDYSPDVVAAAAAWLDEVIYNYRLNQPAMKDPPRTWCEAACGHFSTCRMYDSDVEGLITDENLNLAIEVYAEGAAMEKDGKRLKDEAKKALVGVAGYTGSHQVRWIHVNGSTTPAMTRNGHDRLSVTLLKK